MSLVNTTMKTSVGELQRDYLSKLVIARVPSALPQFNPPSVDSKSGLDSPLDPNATEHPIATVQMSTNNFDVTKEVVDLYNTKGIWPKRSTGKLELYWAGEKQHYSGRDESEKSGQLVFRLDEGMAILDFWEALKELTGTLGNHAATSKPAAVMDLDIYRVNLGKNMVTDYRGLIDVMVWSIDTTQPDKEGSGICTVTVDISWDAVKRDYSKRGMII